MLHLDTIQSMKDIYLVSTQELYQVESIKVHLYVDIQLALHMGLATLYHNLMVVHRLPLKLQITNTIH